MEEDLAARFNPRVVEVLKATTSSTGFGALLGLEVDDAAPGEITCSLPIKPELQSGVGLVHGGAIASLVDHTLSLAVYPVVEPGVWVATTEFKINYLGSVREGRLRAVGKVVSLRKRLAVVRVDVDNDGRPVAVAQGTLYVKDRPGEGKARAEG